MKPLTESEAFAQVDAALYAQRLMQPPATLAPAVLARVRRLKAAERPRFRLTAFDLVLPLLGSLVVAVLWLTLTIPLAGTQHWAQELAYIQLQARWLWLYMQPFLPVTLSGWFGVVVVGGTLITAGVVFTLHQTWSAHQKLGTS